MFNSAQLRQELGPLIAEYLVRPDKTSFDALKQEGLQMVQQRLMAAGNILDGGRPAKPHDIERLWLGCLEEAIMLFLSAKRSGKIIIATQLRLRNTIEEVVHEMNQKMAQSAIAKEDDVHVR